MALLTLSSAGLCRHRVSQPAVKAAAALSQPRWALLLLCYKMRSSGFLYMACDLMAGPRLHGDGSQGACGELLEHSRGSCPPREGSTPHQAASPKYWDTVPPRAEPTALTSFPGTVKGAARNSQSPRTKGIHSQGISGPGRSRKPNHLRWKELSCAAAPLA